MCCSGAAVVVPRADRQGDHPDPGLDQPAGQDERAGVPVVPDVDVGLVGVLPGLVPVGGQHPVRLPPRSKASRTRGEVSMSRARARNRSAPSIAPERVQVPAQGVEPGRAAALRSPSRSRSRTGRRSSTASPNGRNGPSASHRVVDGVKMLPRFTSVNPSGAISIAVGTNGSPYRKRLRRRGGLARFLKDRALLDADQRLTVRPVENVDVSRLAGLGKTLAFSRRRSRCRIERQDSVRRSPKGRDGLPENASGTCRFARRAQRSRQRTGCRQDARRH